MKKIITLVALVLAFASGANAATDTTFNVGTFVKNISGYTGIATYTPTRTDTIHYHVQLCNDSLFAGTIFDGLPKMHVGSTTMIIDTIGTVSDTTVCWMRIVGYHNDTDTAHTVIYDTSATMCMNKVPNLASNFTSTTDSIHYTLTVTVGNGNHRMVIVKSFLDSMHSFGFCFDTFYVSGWNTVVINGVVRSALSTCWPYYFEIDVINPVSGTVTQYKMKKTACPLVSTPYIGLGGSTVVTANTGKPNLNFDLYSRNADFMLFYRRSTVTTWDSLAITGFDTTLTGTQNKQPLISGLLPSTAYVFDVRGRNVLGTSYLGTQTFTTTAPLPVYSITGPTSSYPGGGRVATSFAYSNTPGGSCTLTCALIHNGSILSTIPFYSMYGAATIDTGFAVIDTGMFGITVWGYDSHGTYLTTDTSWVRVPPTGTTLAIKNIANNVEGTVYVYSMEGILVGYYNARFNERRNISIDIPNGNYITVFYKDGQRISVDKIGWWVH